MMYRKIVSKFKTDYKKIKHNTLLVEELEKVLLILENGTTLPKKYSDHGLQGIYKGLRECHIKPDLLLVYKISESELTLYLLRLGSHSDLF